MRPEDLIRNWVIMVAESADYLQQAGRLVPFLMKYEVCVAVWVSQGVRPTHYDTDINKSEALWFSRPGKVS